MNFLSLKFPKTEKSPKLQNPDRVKAVTVELALRAANMTKKDIASWRQAWQAATHPEYPNRVRLYEVYADVEVDLHLSGCISQRENTVLQKAFKLVDASGAEKPEISEIFEAGWFKDFLRYSLDSRYWGYSLIQFGDRLTVAGKPRFDGVEVVPRTHVVPEFGVITRDAGDDPARGFSYTAGKIADWCIGVGNPKDLGLLLKCSPPAISKKNMLAFWDGFGELFGMPVRIGKTVSRDPAEITKIENMLSGMGAAAWGLFPEGTEIDIKETTRGDAFNVYDRRIDRANSEISKGILNQTMTIDSGSSYSQSEVHLEIFRNIVEADADFLRDTVNNRLLPFMTVHGFPVAGMRFEWDDAVEYSPDQMRAVEQMLLSAGYEIEPEYFAQKYGIPVAGRRDVPPPPPQQLSLPPGGFFGCPPSLISPGGKGTAPTGKSPANAGRQTSARQSGR
jgi:hypothetical protein